VHAALLFMVSIALTLAGRFGGIFGVVGAGALIILSLLSTRVSVARLLAPLSIESRQTASSDADPLRVYVAKSADEGLRGQHGGV